MFLLLLGGCSGWKSDKYEDHPAELISMFHPKWFEANSEHSVISSSTGIPESHLFFDLTPEFSMDNRQVNVVITTPAESEQNYRLDPVSGQRHYAYSYCSNNLPSYSIGHIPRMLDQLGTPQKVLLFGSNKKVRDLMSYNFFRVRLVGAYVEKTCPEGDCADNRGLLSRLVFLAVDPDSKDMRDVKELADFLKKVEWKELRLALESIDGKNFSEGRTFKYISVGKPLPFGEAFDFFKGHSIFISDNELKKIKSGCHALYDKLWNEVGLEHEEDKAAQTIQELKEKIKLRDELKKQGRPIGFAKRLESFTKKYFDEVATCNKFVYAGNINKNPDKFWFLSYMNLFFMLHKDGYYFDCRGQSWQRNLLNNRGISVYDIKVGIEDCDEGDLDLAMAYVPNFLTTLRLGTIEMYRFVDYDNHVFGAHSKLYSWVKIPVKKFECTGDQNAQITKELSIFPEDAKWKTRKIKDIESDMKIIY